MSETPLCTVGDIADGGSAGFVADLGARKAAVMAIRQGDRVFVYENVCPHIGSPLDFRPGQFLNPEGTHIMCATHLALFRIDDGVCTAGPCEGDALTPVPVQIRDGRVYLRANV